MIEIRVRYHRRHSSEIVKLRPITKARQNAEETKARQNAEETEARQNAEETKARQIAEETKTSIFLSYTRLGLRSPIVERNYHNCLTISLEWRRWYLTCISIMQPSSTERGIGLAL